MPNEPGARVERVETVVVGAGVSGLAYAHARGPGADLVVLEADDRAGGLLRTLRGGPGGELTYEWGPEAITASNAATRELLVELGLETRPLPPSTRHRYVVHGPRGASRLEPVPLSPPALLRTRLLSPAGKLRVLGEPLRAPATALDGSLAEFVQHRLGREVLERLVDPMVAGIHAARPEELSARAAFPRLVELVERHGSLLRGLRAARGGPRPALVRPAGGVEALARALAATLGTRLRLRSAARALRAQGGTWAVHTDRGRLEARRVVLALPTPAAARLVERAAPAWSATLASLEQVGLVSVVHAWGRAQVGHALDGFGFLVPSSRGGGVLGTLFSSSIDPSVAPEGWVVLRTLLGGTRAPDAPERDDAALVRAAVEDARPLLDLRGPPSWSAVDRHPAALPHLGLEHLAWRERLKRDRPAGLETLGGHAGGIGISALVEAARRLARDHTVAP